MEVPLEVPLRVGADEKVAADDAVDQAQQTVATPGPDEAASSAPASPEGALPERTLLVQQNTTRLYAARTDQPWAIPTQAFVLPIGPRERIWSRRCRCKRSYPTSLG